VAIIVSVSVLGESIKALLIIGGAMILYFTLINELKSKAKQASKPQEIQIV